GAVIGQQFHNLGDGGPLLTNRAVNADQVVALVVDDSVNGDCGFSGLAVSDDQLALSAADRNHAIDGLEARSHGLAHRLAIDDTGSQSLQSDELVRGDRPLIVDGLAERVHHATHERIAYRDAHDAAGAHDLVAFLDFGVLPEKHYADLVFFQIHGDAGNIVRERQQFAGHGLVQSMHPSDSVAQGDHGANFVHRNLRFVVLDLLPDQLCDLVCFDLRHMNLISCC